MWGTATAAGSPAATPEPANTVAPKPGEDTFTCNALVWFRSNGKVQAAQVIKSTGSSLLDRACLNGAIAATFTLKPGATATGDRWGRYVFTFLTGLPAKQSPELRGKGVAIPELARDQVLNFDPPYYPETALQQHKEGVCVMHIVVAADGQPRKIEITEPTGTPDLDSACVSTIRAAKFIPAQRDGKSVAAATDVWLAWRLPD
jgi:TonB family protein